MQKHLTKIATKAAGIGLFLIALAMAGLGLVVMFYLALFALVAAGLGILAAPLVRLIGRPSEEFEQESTTQFGNSFLMGGGYMTAQPRGFRYAGSTGGPPP